MKIIDVRGMELSLIYDIDRHYPPNLYEQFGIIHTDRLTTKKDIELFHKVCVKHNSPIQIIDNYGQTGYKPIIKRNDF